MRYEENKNETQTKGTEMTIQHLTEVFCKTTRKLMDAGLSEQDAKTEAKNIMNAAIELMSRKEV